MIRCHIPSLSIHPKRKALSDLHHRNSLSRMPALPNPGRSRAAGSLLGPFLAPLFLLGACASPQANTPDRSSAGSAAQASMNGTAAAPNDEGYAAQYRPPRNPDSEAGFGEQWYSGTAEINAYDLEQERYGAIRPGEAVLVFVTEDFHARDQVKLDRPPADPKDQVKVLKMNGMRSFETGVYAYQTMRSVFTPVQLAEHPATLKSTTSVQEWCGMVFQQINRSEAGFEAEWRSYFQSEGDAETALPDVLLEDEVFNRIRLAPETLPTGSFSALPSSLDIRLYHLPVRAVSAEGRFEELEEGQRLYRLRYTDSGTELRVRFSADFPREILGWEKERRVGGRAMTTRATRRSVEHWPYWRYNGLADTSYRRALGL